MPRRSILLVTTLTLLILAGRPGPYDGIGTSDGVGPDGTARAHGIAGADPATTDPIEDAARALAEGRPWHASVLLRGLAQPDSPATALLSARADAGRLAWHDVIRRLGSAGWVDSIRGGEGRALLARARLETGAYEAAARDYRRFLDYALDRRERGLAEVGHARALLQLRRPREAAAAFGRAAELLSSIEPWLALRAAEALAPSGDTARVAGWLERTPDVPAWRRAMAWAEALRRSGDSTAAIEQLLTAAEDEASGARAVELRTRAARWQLAAGDTGAARATLRDAIRTDPGSALEAADLLSVLPGDRAADHLLLARAYERSGAPARAVPELRAYMGAEAPGAGERLEIELRIGELLFRSGNYVSAAAALERTLAREPPRSIAARAELVLARSLYRSGRRAEGRQGLRRVADRYRGSTVALRALSLLAGLYDSGEGGDRAEALYLEMARDYPGTRLGGDARFRLGMLALANGDLEGARDHFDTARRQNRRGELGVQAAYWAARARLALGGDAAGAEAIDLFEEVRAFDPYGYYGLLAAEQLGVDPWADLPPGPSPGTLDSTLVGAFASIETLRAAGLADEAALALDAALEVEPQEPAELLALSDALARYGYGGRAVRLGWLAHARLRGHWSRSVLQAIYPLAYPRILLAEANERGLEPALLAAVARQESHFSPEAISRAGARGLLQLMPATAREWARRAGVRGFREDLLFHPEINMHLGAAYLAHLRERHPELQLALIAYNAGPTRARRWRERPLYDPDPQIFAERIPFTETRTYVKAIQRHLRIYRALYGEQLGGVARAPNTR